MSPRSESLTVTALRVVPLRDDSITVVMHDMGAGHGKLVLESWGAAWSCVWGAMGDQDAPMTVRQFVLAMPAGYVANCLIRGARGHMLARAQDRMQRRLEAMVQEVQQALRGEESHAWCKCGDDRRPGFTHSTDSCWTVGISPAGAAGATP